MAASPRATNPLAFGTETVGSGTYGYAYAYNVGTSNASISSVVLGGANAGDFSIYENYCGTIGVGGSCYVTLYFTPTATGPRTATLTFTDSTPGSPHTVTLTGTGQ